MNTVRERIQQLRAKLNTPLPAIERKPVEARKVVVRDHRVEAGVDQDILGMFEDLRKRENLLRNFKAIKDDRLVDYEGKKLSLAEVIPLMEAEISGTKQAIKDDFNLPEEETLGLYPRWIEGRLSVEDKLAVSLDLVVREVLNELSEQENEDMRVKSQQYREACRARKDGDDEPERPEGLQRVFRVPVIVRHSASQTETRYRYFVKRWHERGEAPHGSHALFMAYLNHHNQQAEYAKKQQKNATDLAVELKVDEGKTIRDVEAGQACVSSTEVKSAHGWEVNGVPQVGRLFVKCHGTVGGVASLEIRATGGIAWCMRHEIGQVFEYKPGTRFEGIANAETKEFAGKLRAFLMRVGEFSDGPRRSSSGPRSPQFASQYQPQTPPGQQSEEYKQARGPKEGKGRKPKKGRGGGQRRDDADRFEGEE